MTVLTAAVLAAVLAAGVPSGYEGSLIEDPSRDAGTGRPVLDDLARPCDPPHRGAELTETPHDIFVTRTEALQPVGAEATDPVVVVQAGSVLPGVVCDGPHGWTYAVQEGQTFLVPGVLDLGPSAAEDLSAGGVLAVVTDPPSGSTTAVRERPGDRSVELARLAVGDEVTAGPAYVGRTAGLSSMLGARLSWVPIETADGLHGWIDSAALVVAAETEADVWGELETVTTTVTRETPVYVPRQRIDPAAVRAPASPGTESGVLEPGTEVVRSAGMWDRPTLGWAGAAGRAERAGELPEDLAHLASLLVVVEVRPGVLGWAPAWLDAEAAAPAQTTPTEPDTPVEPTLSAPTTPTEPAAEPVPTPAAEDGPGLRERVSTWWAERGADDGPTVRERVADASGWTAMQRTMAWMTAALVGLPGLVLLGVAWVRARRRATGTSTAGTVARAALSMTPAGLLRWAPAWPLGLALTAWAVTLLPGGVLPALVTVAGAGAAAVTSGQVLAGRAGVLLDALRPVREQTVAGAGTGAVVGLAAGLLTAWSAGLVLGAATAGAGIAWMAARNGAVTEPDETDTTDLTEDEETVDA